MKNNALTRELLSYADIISDFAGKIFSLLKRFVKIKADFYADMGKGQKRWFIFCNLFLSAYMTFVFFISRSDIFLSTIKTLAASVQSVLFFLIIYNAIVFFCFKFGSIAIDISGKKTKVKWETIILFSAPCFFILLLALAACFPGGMSPDTANQWWQVHSLGFTDWHPVIHTLLIWLVTRIIDYYGFVIFIQITVFSIGVGHLIATLESWGFNKKILLVIGLLIILNPYTMNIMMYPLKDSAFTIFVMYTTIMTVNIYFSKGAWFSKGINIVLFALTTGLASMVRHNGFFFTVPLYVIIVFMYSKKYKGGGG